MAETAFCYHCRQHHPLTEMRRMGPEGSKRWRCIRSIEASKRSQKERDAFGREVTQINKSEAASRMRMLNPELTKGPSA